MPVGKIIPRSTLKPREYQVLARQIESWAAAHEVFWRTRQSIDDMARGRPPRSLASLFDGGPSVSLASNLRFVAFDQFAGTFDFERICRSLRRQLDPTLLDDVLIDGRSWDEVDDDDGRPRGPGDPGDPLEPGGDRDRRRSSPEESHVRMSAADGTVVEFGFRFGHPLLAWRGIGRSLLREARSALELEAHGIAPDLGGTLRRPAARAARDRLTAGHDPVPPAA